MWLHTNPIFVIIIGRRGQTKRFFKRVMSLPPLLFFFILLSLINHTSTKVLLFMSKVKLRKINIKETLFNYFKKCKLLCQKRPSAKHCGEKGVMSVTLGM